MRLYNFAFGPYPQRVTIYLAEKGITDVDLVLLDAPTGKAPWPPSEIAALTPTGSLPIIVDIDGTTVTQSLAILEYLEDTRPLPDMRGETATDRARTRQFVSVFDEALDAFALWARYRSDMGGHDKDAHREVIEVGSGTYFKKLRLAERMLHDTKFLAGNSVTIADCVAMAMLQFTAGFYDVPIPPDCARLISWESRFSARPSVRKCDFPADQRRSARDLMKQTGVAF